MARVRHSAFSLIELLVVIAIIVILIAVMVPALASSREQARKSQCAANLSGIGKAALVYAAEAADRLPCQPPPYGTFGYWSYPAAAGGNDGTIEAAITSVFTDNGGGGTPFYLQQGDPSANFWLLVLKGYATPPLFVCPSDPKSPTPAMVGYNGGAYAGVGYFNNFGAASNGNSQSETCSYGFVYPWHADGESEAPWWRSTAGNFLPLAADIGPAGISALNDPTGPAGMPISNSKNHAGRGQNVLYLDAHVAFSKDNRAGHNGDNIYTASGGQDYVASDGASFNQMTSINLPFENYDLIMTPARK